ncbi:MAG: DUF309 domain-containing protein [Halothece sp.]
MPSAAFWQGIAQFNQQQFYACHDTFEELWMEAELRDRAFYQGLLQIAVGCYHLSNSNWRGAVTLLGEGMARLEDYEPTYFQIDVSKLLDESSVLLESLQDISEENMTAWVASLQANSLPTIITMPGGNYDSEIE